MMNRPKQKPLMAKTPDLFEHGMVRADGPDQPAGH